MLALCAVVYVIWTDDQGVHHPQVMTGKCRVAPLVGTTIPRGELQGLVVLHRLVLTVVEAYPYKFRSIDVFTDSLCSMGALEKSSTALRPFFGNQVAEVHRIREQLETRTDYLAPISHVLGEDNSADLGTRGQVGIGDIGPGSTWQLGPSFLRRDYELWPRAHTSAAAAAQVPAEECNVLCVVEEAPLSQEGVSVNPVMGVLREVATKSRLAGLLQGLCARVLTREKLELAVRVLARVLGAVVAGRRDAVRREPGVKLVQVAVSMLLRDSARSARLQLKLGALRGLGAEDRDGIIWVTGRIRGEQLATLLGTAALPVLLASESLA